MKYETFIQKYKTALDWEIYTNKYKWNKEDYYIDEYKKYVDNLGKTPSIKKKLIGTIWKKK